MRVVLGALAVGLAVLAGGCSAGGTGVIRIGVIGDCEGSFSFGYESALAGAELPLIDRGARLRGAKPSDGIKSASAAGKRVELLFGCERSNRATAIAELRRLVEQEGANAVVGLNISHEGLVMRDYARQQPGVTFIFAGIDQSTTLKAPSPNVFRFRPGPAQWAAGLGAYAYRELGWRSAVTISEDDFFGWTSVAGFVAEFCSLGGNVTQRRWFPADPNFKFGRLVSTIPEKGIDGAFLTDGLFDTHSFVAAWGARHHNLARSLVTEDNLVGENANDPRLLGVVASNTSPWADTPRWKRYTADFMRAFPKLQASNSVDSFDSMEPLLDALVQVRGDLSAWGARPDGRAGPVEVRLSRGSVPSRLEASGGQPDLPGPDAKSRKREARRAADSRRPERRADLRRVLQRDDPGSKPNSAGVQTRPSSVVD